VAGNATGESTGNGARKAGFGRRLGRRFGSLRVLTELGPGHAAGIAEHDEIGEIVDEVLMRGFRNVRTIQFQGIVTTQRGRSSQALRKNRDKS
jgi:hypothetical protein